MEHDPNLERILTVVEKMADMLLIVSLRLTALEQAVYPPLLPEETKEKDEPEETSASPAASSTEPVSPSSNPTDPA